MTDKLLTSTATVRLTVEVSGLGNWNKDCTAQQIYDQAGSEAKSKLMRHLHSSGVGFTVVGEPKVS